MLLVTVVEHPGATAFAAEAVLLATTIERLEDSRIHLFEGDNREIEPGRRAAGWMR